MWQSFDLSLTRFTGRPSGVAPQDVRQPRGVHARGLSRRVQHRQPVDGPRRVVLRVHGPEPKGYRDAEIAGAEHTPVGIAMLPWEDVAPRPILERPCSRTSSRRTRRGSHVPGSTSPTSRRPGPCSVPHRWSLRRKSQASSCSPTSSGTCSCGSRRSWRTSRSPRASSPCTKGTIARSSASSRDASSAARRRRRRSASSASGCPASSSENCRSPSGCSTPPASAPPSQHASSGSSSTTTRSSSRGFPSSASDHRAREQPALGPERPAGAGRGADRVPGRRARAPPRCGLFRARRFLDRNQIPFRWLQPDVPADAAALGRRPPGRGRPAGDPDRQRRQGRRPAAVAARRRAARDSDRAGVGGVRHRDRRRRAGGPRSRRVRSVGGPPDDRDRVRSARRPGRNVVADRELPRLPVGRLRRLSVEPGADASAAARRRDRRHAADHAHRSRGAPDPPRRRRRPPRAHDHPRVRRRLAKARGRRLRRARREGDLLRRRAQRGSEHPRPRHPPHRRRQLGRPGRDVLLLTRERA